MLITKNKIPTIAKPGSELKGNTKTNIVLTNPVSAINLDKIELNAPLVDIPIPKLKLPIIKIMVAI